MPAAFHPAVAALVRAAPSPHADPGAGGRVAADRARRRHVLIAAPTGSGKTLAAFLAVIDALVREGLAAGGLRG